jgi:AraC family transcriptional activator of mtrCDE
MRAESATENRGGLAMLNALSTALFAISLRLASEVTAPPDGLLALAANPRLRSASDLLTDIRMTVAANALKTSDMSTGALAEFAGYRSEAVFQRAFKHQMGLTPAQWRRTHQRSTELRLGTHNY